MFFKGFICGWIGMAAIVIVHLWGMTPRLTGAEYGYELSYAVGYQDC